MITTFLPVVYFLSFPFSAKFEWSSAGMLVHNTKKRHQLHNRGGLVAASSPGLYPPPPTSTRIYTYHPPQLLTSAHPLLSSVIRISSNKMTVSNSTNVMSDDLYLEDFDDTSIFENKAGLAEDMRFLASIPELCDITFLVGETREPVCAVKAVLAARSK